MSETGQQAPEDSEEEAGVDIEIDMEVEVDVEVGAEDVETIQPAAVSMKDRGRTFELGQPEFRPNKLIVIVIPAEDPKPIIHEYPMESGIQQLYALLERKWKGDIDGEIIAVIGELVDVSEATPQFTVDFGGFRKIITRHDQREMEVIDAAPFSAAADEIAPSDE